MALQVACPSLQSISGRSAHFHTWFRKCKHGAAEGCPAATVHMRTPRGAPGVSRRRCSSICPPRGVWRARKIWKLLHHEMKVKSPRCQVRVKTLLSFFFVFHQNHQQLRMVQAEPGERRCLERCHRRADSEPSPSPGLPSQEQTPLCRTHAPCLHFRAEPKMSTGQALPSPSAVGGTRRPAVPKATTVTRMPDTPHFSSAQTSPPAPLLDGTPLPPGSSTSSLAWFNPFGAQKSPQAVLKLEMQWEPQGLADPTWLGPPQCFPSSRCGVGAECAFPAGSPAVLTLPHRLRTPASLAHL